MPNLSRAHPIAPIAVELLWRTISSSSNDSRAQTAGPHSACAEQTPCTSQSCSPQLPRPRLGMLLTGGWQGGQTQLSGLPNQHPLQTFPGNFGTSEIEDLEIPISDMLNYWCQVPQSPLLMVFLATAFNLLVHNGHAEFNVHSKLLFNLMLIVKCQAAPRVILLPEASSCSSTPELLKWGKQNCF